MIGLRMANYKEDLEKDLKAKVFTFLGKLQIDDTSPGLHIEPMQKPVDDRVRTARVDQQFRAVLFKLTSPVGVEYVYVGTWNHDDAIDREFNTVCHSVWGYTTDDISDDLFSDADHAFLDSLDEAHARIFAAEQGYDLVDDDGMLTDWWGYCWMILAEKRGLLTPENRAAARAQIEEKYRAAPNVIGVIVGR